MNGQLGKKLASDLFREIANGAGNGLLRISNGKTIKAIFFESGSPVFAISNLAKEQIDQALIKRGVANQSQIAEAKSKAEKPQHLGAVMVGMGIVGEADLRQAAGDLAKQIILSVFEWSQGEYVFDERVRVPTDGKLEWTVSDCLVEAGRGAGSRPEVAALLAPEDAVLLKSKATGKLAQGGKLNSVESYLYSRVDGATPLGEMGMLTGFPDSDCRQAVAVLVALGLLKIEGRDAPDGESPEGEAEGKLIEEMAEMGAFFANADYFEMLGLTLRSSMADVKAAYYKMAKKYHPDRFRQAESAELRSKAEELFARITEAYETLSDPPRRAVYEEKLKKPQKTAPLTTQPLKPQTSQVPPIQRASAARARPTSEERASQSAGSQAPARPPAQQPFERASKPSGQQPPQPHQSAQPPSRQSGPLPGARPAEQASGARKGTGDLSGQGRSGPLFADSEKFSDVRASHESPSGALGASSVAGDSQPASAAAQSAQGETAGPKIQNPPPAGATADFYYNQGRSRLEQQDYYGAVRLLREAVRIDPSKPQYHFHLGSALIKSPRTRREGEQHMVKAAGLDPFNATIRVRLGVMYKEAGLPKKAEHYFKEALALEPTNRAALKEMGGEGKKEQQAGSVWKSDLGTLAKKLFKK